MRDPQKRVASPISSIDQTSAPSLVQLASELRDALTVVDYTHAAPWVYHPLTYAWEAHKEYLYRYGSGRKQILFLGMNPGPWGMMQTGIPFGEVAAVRDFLRIDFLVGRPARVHPKHPIHGMSCKRSEVSGRRFWGMFERRFGTADRFFEKHFVANYCPVAFLDEGGRNVTPDKLPSPVRSEIDRICLKHLQNMIELLRPDWVIGVGVFATQRIEVVRRSVREGASPKAARDQQNNADTSSFFQVATMLHPSPASPLANKNWEATATEQLIEQGVWQGDS